MRLKKVPQVPVRRKMDRQDDLCDYKNLGEIVEKFKTLGVDCNDVEIKYDYDSSYLFYKVDENNEQFQSRMEKYESDVLAYDVWYKSNKEEIDVELEKRALKLEAKQEKDRIVREYNEKIKEVEKEWEKKSKNIFDEVGDSDKVD